MKRRQTRIHASRPSSPSVIAVCHAAVPSDGIAKTFDPAATTAGSDANTTSIGVAGDTSSNQTLPIGIAHRGAYVEVATTHSVITPARSPVPASAPGRTGRRTRPTDPSPAPAGSPARRSTATVHTLPGGTSSLALALLPGMSTQPFLMFQLLSTAGGVPVVVPCERC